MAKKRELTRDQLERRVARDVDTRNTRTQRIREAEKRGLEAESQREHRETLRRRIASDRAKLQRMKE